MKKALTLIAFIAAGLTANAQFYQQGPKLTATGLMSNASFGWSSSISGDGNTAIAGAPGYNSGDAGAAVIYNRSGNSWSQGTTLIGTGATGGANQGQSVAISADGNTAIVGGPNDNGTTGAAWIFVKSGNTWVQQGGKLVGTGATGAAYQGYSVSISSDGNTAVVGAPGDNTGLGAVWVFTRTGNAWAQWGTKLVGSGALSNASYPAYQGYSVCISANGNKIILGAHGDNAGHGAAWIFTLSGNSWVEETKASGTGNFIHSGASVSISADGATAIIGSPAADNNYGMATIFHNNGSGWGSQGDLIGAFPVGNAQQGSSVSISADGNTAVVGGGASIFTPAPGDVGTGAVWVYTRSGSNWYPMGPKLVGAGAAGNSQQGTTVDISGDGQTIITGGFGDNNYAGAVWLYSTSMPSSVSSMPIAIQAGTYPNPNTGRFTINASSPVESKLAISIMNMQGQQIQELSGTTNTDIPVTLDAPAGVYFIEMATNDSKTSSQFILAK